MKIPKLETMVKVHWLDTFSVEAWCSNRDIDEEFKHPIIVKTIGYIARDNDDFLAVSMGIQKDNLAYKPYCFIEFIPKGCIKKIEILTIKRSKK